VIFTADICNYSVQKEICTKSKRLSPLAFLLATASVFEHFHKSFILYLLTPQVCQTLGAIISFSMICNDPKSILSFNGRRTPNCLNKNKNPLYFYTCPSFVRQCYKTEKNVPWLVPVFRNENQQESGMCASVIKQGPVAALSASASCN